MSKIFESTIEKELLENGSFATCAKGESMRPMLRGGRDMVVIEPISKEIKKYDVILFKDKSSRYVLHRVIKIKDSVIITRGDNTYFTETVGTENVLGILTKYNKNGKSYDVNSLSSRLYARRRVFFYYPRKLSLKLKRLVCAAARKIFKKRK